jgi:hypothetical protein
LSLKPSECRNREFTVQGIRKPGNNFILGPIEIRPVDIEALGSNLCVALGIN